MDLQQLAVRARALVLLIEHEDEECGRGVNPAWGEMIDAGEELAAALEALSDAQNHPSRARTGRD